jgi:sulfur carrier protein
MKIIVNGSIRIFEENATLKSVIQELQIEDKVMASAINMNIIKKENWENYILKEGDKLELLEFVGGG